VRARKALSIEYERVANRRGDFLHKLTTRLIAQHDLVAIEDIGLTGLAKTKLAGQLQDAALRELRRQLEYKGETFGVRVVTVDRFFPSSKLCYHCGHRLTELPLAKREWRCVCGALNDRDLNAARNLLAEGLRINSMAAGLADMENARGARVRLPMEAAGAET
jgi:putative transposase